MSRLIVTAAASPMFGNFIMLVSVSTENEGKSSSGLKPVNFKIHHLASLNHAFASERKVTKATEGPNGFYILELKPEGYQPDLPPGHYVFAVAVETFLTRAAKVGEAKKLSAKDHGQTVAVGDLPSYGQWKNA